MPGKDEKILTEMERHLGAIAALFNPTVKLTFIARTPGSPSADIMITSDSVEQISQVCMRQMQKVITDKLAKDKAKQDEPAIYKGR